MTSGRRSRLGERLLALGIGVGAGAGGVELGARAFGLGRPDAAAHAAGERGAIQRYAEELNHHGYHDYEWKTWKRAGTWRVAFLGDSFTEGKRVARDDLFVKRLERALNARAAEGRRFELLNVARGGWGTFQQLQALRALVEADLKLDAVVVVYFVNDATAMSSNVAVDEAAPDDGGWLAWSHAWRFARERLRARWVTRRTLAEYRAAFEGDGRAQAQWQRSKEALAEMRALADAEGFELGVVLFPVLADLTEDHALAPLYAMVGEHCRSLGVPFESLLPAFHGREARALWVAPDNAHPNAEANRLVVEPLERFLVRERLVRGVLP